MQFFHIYCSFLVIKVTLSRYLAYKTDEFTEFEDSVIVIVKELCEVIVVKCEKTGVCMYVYGTCDNAHRHIKIREAGGKGTEDHASKGQQASHHHYRSAREMVPKETP